MQDFGFIFPNGNYILASGETVEAVLAMLPEGTINVPLQPSPDYVWQNGQWVLGGPTDDMIIDRIINAPVDLTGGPTLGEIYNGN